jgi:pimeloyl-ACP methyl ester carboxylesterase
MATVLKMGKGGMPVIILIGLRRNMNAYKRLQGVLAKKRKVILVDVPGLILQESYFINPQKLADRIAEIANKNTGGRDFVVITHCFSSSFALPLLSDGPRCRGAIFLNPGFVNKWQFYLWQALLWVIHFFGFLESLKWIRNNTAVKIAIEAMRPVKKANVNKPLLLVIGKRDPLNCFFLMTGWKKIPNCRIEHCHWGHSPQKKMPDKLVAMIEGFLKEFK